MAHQTMKSGYAQLVSRLNRHPQGAPPSELLYKILKILFEETEAERVAALPIKPFTASTAGRLWKVSAAEARRTLDALADRGILLDVAQDGESVYILPPPMAGFFEFSLMRVRHDIDQKALSELFYEYLNVEEDFITELACPGPTQVGRTFVQEPVLLGQNTLYVLDHDRASEVIKQATHRCVGICYCRHKMQHLGKACDAPQAICMSFNAAASSLINHGCARSAEKEECLDLLHAAYEHNLVQFGENVREQVNFICHCCGCCCEAMLAARRFAILNPVHTTHFIPVVSQSDCNGCGRCVAACPVAAMTLVEDGTSRQVANLDEGRCLGCGICIRACRKRCLHLTSRKQRIITPLNTTHRVVLMAIERGKLQNLIFDNQLLWSHRAMAAVLGVILRLPPLKQALANEQVKSRCLATLIKTLKLQSI